MLEKRVKAASVSDLCNRTEYDTFDDLSRSYVPVSLYNSMLKYACSDVNRLAIDSAIDGRPVEFLVDTQGEKVLNDGVVEKLAEAYLSYELSAIDAIVRSRRGNPEQNTLELEALVSANNLQKR